MQSASARRTQVVYLGISGVLHPSRSLYHLLLGREPEADGHTEFESVPVLERALQLYKDVRIVLTSTLPKKHGLARTLEWLGPALSARVSGFTFDDLTTKCKRDRYRHAMSAEDYWRSNKSEIVRAHVGWLQPAAWIAIDDESILWLPQERLCHLVYVDGTLGLRDLAAQDRLATLLYNTFELADSCVDGPTDGEEKP